MHSSELNLSRRDFIKAASGLAGGLVISPFDLAQASAAAPKLSVSDLPRGSAPKPVPLPHFPGPLHAFLWRNWPLVPTARLAAVVGARPREIIRLGHAMGLGAPPPISRDQWTRSYLTIIRRNWHLLPYEQLLQLLDWNAEQLAFTLREDDFLFVKLGSLKPQCEPLRYRPSDSTLSERARESARILREELPALKSTEPLFGFVAQLSRPTTTRTRRITTGQLKFCYSYFALYGDALLSQASDPYPDAYLERLAQAGVNGVWLQAVLYKLAPFPWQPELSAEHKARLGNLRQLVARARKHGIQVFLYLNEPRAMQLRFFERFPHLRGVTEADHAALCTSQTEVQSYLVDSIATICRTVPDLGGFFSITASENLTNCWSHGQGNQCPRCGPRSAPEVIAEVNSLFCRGMSAALHRESPEPAISAVNQPPPAPATAGSPRLLVWDWGWDDAWAGVAIRRLPAQVALMSVSEWELPIDRGGVKTTVGEYSISAIGPSPRAQGHWQLAHERGLDTIAKIQAGNTWELAAVPYLPAIENVARHAENLRSAGVKGLMLGWTLGGYPSPNLEVVSEILAGASPEVAMGRVAQRRVGKELAPALVAAWRQFSAAFQEFPFHTGVLYSGPQQLGPANLLWPEPTRYQATMVGFPYDDLESWRAIYPPEIFIQQFEKVAAGFGSALDELQHATRKISVGQSHRAALEAECRVAEAAAIHFHSTANQARFVLARRSLAAVETAPAAAAALETLETLLKDEIALARRLYQLQSADSRIGFEASNQYFYIPIDLAEKILNCRYLLDHWLPALRSRQRSSK